MLQGMEEVTAGDDDDATGPRCSGAMSGVAASSHSASASRLPAGSPGGGAASGCTRSRARHPLCCGVSGSAKAPEVMTAQVPASNTKTPQVREPEKINTETTRTKRHYPAHGSTAAKIAMQAPDQPLCRSSGLTTFIGSANSGVTGLLLTGRLKVRVLSREPCDVSRHPEPTSRVRGSCVCGVGGVFRVGGLGGGRWAGSCGWGRG